MLHNPNLNADTDISSPDCECAVTSTNAENQQRIRSVGLNADTDISSPDCECAVTSTNAENQQRIRSVGLNADTDISSPDCECAVTSTNAENQQRIRSVVVNISGTKYEIRIGEGLFEALPAILSKQHPGKKLAVVCETRVAGLMGRKLASRLQSSGCDAFLVEFPEGEIHKTLDTLSSLYEALAVHQFTRSDIVVAVGGGVTGDMAGLAAATFLRGTGFVQVPTTLLAMVDSSIGGKVAVDLPGGKNLVGAFFQPNAVYTDPLLLDTLPDRQFANGMAELVKHGFLFDATLVGRISAHHGRGGLRPHMAAFIAESCNLKRLVVEQDEKDEGPRRLLNFGHTLGHALEKATGFNTLAHGEAISIGMTVFTRMSEDMGWSDPGTADAVESVLIARNLPTVFPDIDPEPVLDSMAIDKKARSGMITIVTLDRIGTSRLRTLAIPELKEMLHGRLHR
jgi:3-dehydroquinate synthase